MAYELCSKKQRGNYSNVLNILNVNFGSILIEIIHEKKTYHRQELINIIYVCIDKIVIEEYLLKLVFPE